MQSPSEFLLSESQHEAKRRGPRDMASSGFDYEDYDDGSAGSRTYGRRKSSRSRSPPDGDSLILAPTHNRSPGFFDQCGLGLGVVVPIVVCLLIVWWGYAGGPSAEPASAFTGSPTPQNAAPSEPTLSSFFSPSKPKVKSVYSVEEVDTILGRLKEAATDVGEIGTSATDDAVTAEVSSSSEVHIGSSASSEVKEEVVSTLTRVSRASELSQKLNELLSRRQLLENDVASALARVINSKRDYTRAFESSNQERSTFESSQAALFRLRNEHRNTEKALKEVEDELTDALTSLDSRDSEQRELEAARRQREGDLDEARTRLANHRRNVETMETEFEEMNRQIAGLESSRSSAATELERLRAEESGHHKDLSSKQDLVRDLSSQIQVIEQKVEHVRVNLDRMNQVDRAVKNQLDGDMQIRREMKALEEQLNEAQEKDYLDKDEALVMKVNQDNYRMLKEALERSSASSSVGVELQERAAQRQQLQEQLRVLEAELRSLKERKETAEGAITTISNSLRTVRVHIVEAEKQIDAKSEEHLVQQKSRRDAKEIQLAESKKKTSTLQATLSTKQSAMTKAEAKLSTHLASKEPLENSIANLRASKERHVRDREAVRKEMSTHAGNAEIDLTRHADFQNSVSEKRNVIRTHEQQVAHSRQSVHALDEEMQDILNELQSLLDDGSKCQR